ncbi:DUF1624 domain-containing protein [Mucilaginibacter corticis]|uniref:DUF1624 domain-containing protein n=1 Tax=Mucilaginibacter corticis TaxID=2597670 RepID=A0A556MST5_9SPHI|nr:heparan-alpha-glucosaminide N-acetyltransferase domain-containing protein [Mucilaginibacter corticis]TSJ42983.1 DUF1624 domain-containing protein [Mucilaginibacter corticis]
MNLLAETPKKRIDSIDILRGLVMAIMALDHTRDFFMSLPYEPTDLTRASTILFLTRFITHYCAATFVFLAGTGAFLSLKRGKTKGEAFRFLLSRGLWLIILEITVISVGWGAGEFLQVIWAIGISMMVLAFLIYLPVPLIAAFGLLLIFGHNLFDHVNTAGFTPAEKTEWTLLHVQGFVHLGPINFFVLYPLIPWIGVMAAGYSFGTLFTIDAAKRKKILTVLGLSAIALFIVIRYFAFYGDATTWTYQGNIHRTILSFINVTKYPPSLDYLLITLGPGMLFLAWVEGKSNKLTDIFVVYGRVPLFYYILHLYLIHLLNIIIGLIVPLPQGFFGPQNPGLSLGWVYVIWLSVVFILYFPCRWFMKYKREHKQWWLSYL